MKIKILIALAFACALSSTQVVSANPGWANDYLKRITALIEQKEYEESLELSSQFEARLKEANKKTADSKRLSVAEFMAQLLDKRAEAESKLGEFLKAANTQRESHSFVAKPVNVDKVLDYTTKNGLQEEHFAAKAEFLTKSYVLTQEALALSSEKGQMIKDFLKKSEIKKDELEALQASLKSLDKKIQAKNAEIKKLQDEFEPIFEKFETSEIPFSRDQDEAIIKRDKELSEMAEASTMINESAQTGLLEIVEKYKWGWDGLEEQMTKLKGVQEKLMEIQSQMLKLLEKKTLTEAEKKVLLDLKMKSDKLMGEHALLLADVEKGFMDSKIFSKLTPEQQKKYFEIFKVMHEANKVITETNTKIDEFIKKLVTVYGDFNGDGKFNRKDLVNLSRYLLKRPKKATVDRIRLGDVNGDGKLTWADYTLMRQVVNGQRKLFPVDPQNLPGDMNGDGKISWKDIFPMVRTIYSSKAVDNAWKGVADVNGDDKLDIEDVRDLVKEVKKQEAKKVETNAAPASGAKSVAPGTGDATGKVQTESGNSTDNAKPAAGIDSSY